MRLKEVPGGILARINVNQVHNKLLDMIDVNNDSDLEIAFLFQLGIEALLKCAELGINNEVIDAWKDRSEMIKEEYEWWKKDES